MVSSFITVNNIWIKQLGGNFDIAMGSFNGAEVCELVGLYILNQLFR